MPDLMQESDENKIRIAKELLLEEVHRLQEERSAFEKERDKTMEKLKEQESFFDKKLKILEMGFAQLDADRKSFEAKKRAFEYSRQVYQEKQEKEPFSELAEGEEITETLPADPDVKNYSYTIVDGEVYFRENSVMMRPKLNRTAQERVKSMVALRDTVYRLMNAQLEDADDKTIENEQRELNRQYDAFSTKFGLINDRANRLAFSDDSSYYLLSSLEVLDEDRKLERKADMFTKRTIRRPQAITHTDTAAEAQAVSNGEKARVDMP